MPTPSQLYLDLMKKALVNWIYMDHEREYLEARRAARTPWYKSLRRRLGGKPLRQALDPAKRIVGKDWPAFAHSMVGLKRLDHLQECVETVISEGVPGDLLEAGVWRGGASIFMRAVLAANAIPSRRVWVCDSFEGLPPPDPEKYPADAGDTHHTHEALAVGLEDVRHNFELYDLLDDQVCFVKGWFKDTLPNLPVEELAVVRLDGDMYESTMDGLTALYPKLSPGGFLVIDDYGAIPSCKQAVDDFREQQGITEPMHDVDWTAVYWRKPR